MESDLRERRKAEFADRLREAQSRLFGYIHSLVRDLDDADDLFQQTTLILWNKFEGFDPRRSFVSWACGVARLEACNFLRSRGRQRLYFSDDLNLLLAEVQEEITRDEMDERRDALAVCVGKLRQRDRQLLDECYGREGGVTEVAARHGRSPQSVHNSLRRIRRALFECIRRTLDRRARQGVIA
jgi:RNA polymerase sigma-70 factor (ECF subfamily)